MDILQRYISNPAYKVETFDNEVLLYSIQDGKGLYLNETACLVWELCKKSHSIEEIIKLLEDAYRDQKTTIRDDVVMAVESLVANNTLMTVDE